MPIYEYLCEKCGTHIEKIQKFSDPPLTQCETCAGKVNKILSQSSFVLKGSGWYLTDYSKKSAAPAAAAATPAPAEAAPKCEAKPEGGCGAGACGSGTPSAE